MSNKLLTVFNGATAAFTPASISGLKLWVKADTGLYKDAAKTQPATTNGDAIYTWADQSGNGYDFTQSTLANRPTLATSAQNGLSAVAFDGTNSAMVTASFTALSQPNTVFIVAPVGRSQDYLFDGLASSGRTAAADQLLTVGKMSAYAGAALEYTRTPTSALKVWAFVFNGVSSKIYENGTQVASGNANANTISGFTLGARYALNIHGYGNFCEFIVFNANLSAEDFSKVITYLNSKWAVY